MPQQVRGVVAHKKGDPVSVETIVVPDPGPGEAVVKVQACGVCHTDLHYREGGINDDFPFLLGHEAAGIVESVGEGVTDVAPGDFVILNWRAVCGNCRACRRGEPWYCFNTHNAAQKMTLDSGQELSPALGIGAFVEKTLVHAGQCTKVNPAAKPEVAGLLGCGVMAGHRRRDQHRQGRPRRLHRRHRLRRGRQRRHRRRPARRRVHDHRRRRRRPEARLGQGLRRHAHDQLPRAGRGRGRPGAHRRQRRERRRRRRRPPRDLHPGLLRPRPRRHRRPGRRAHPADARRAAADRRVRPRRRHQVVLVRRLPALPRLPHARSTCTCRAGSRWRSSSPRPSGSTTSRRRSTRCTRARSCARWWSSDGQRRIDHVVTSRDVLPRRRHLGRRQQRLDRRRRERGASSSTPRTTWRRSRPGSAAGASWRSCAPTRTTTTSTRRPPCPTASTRPSTCTRPRRRCGRWRTRTASRTTTCATATCSPRAGSSCR